MPNLFWKNEQGELATLVDTGFKTEEELERYLYQNPRLLGDLVIFSRQTKSSSGKDIPDLLAVDADNNVVIIEIKNTTAQEEVISQLLRYAIWAETNPDGVKNRWLEYKDKPDDADINWDSFNIRIMLVATGFHPVVLRLVHKIGYEVELVQVARFTSGKHEFVLLDERQAEFVARAKVTTGLREWDETWYKQNYNLGSVPVFMHTVRRVEKLVEQKGWKLESKFNKNYVGFKHGFLNVFGVQWIGSKSFCLFFKVPKSVAEKLQPAGLEPLRYEDEWKHVLYKVDGMDYPLEKLTSLFEAAYKNITGVGA